MVLAAELLREVYKATPEMRTPRSVNQDIFSCLKGVHYRESPLLNEPYTCTFMLVTVHVHVHVGLMNALATRQGIPKATWYELWEELQESAANSRPVSPVSHVTKLSRSWD